MLIINGMNYSFIFFYYFLKFLRIFYVEAQELLTWSEHTICSHQTHLSSTSHQAWHIRALT
jgi:hypothetical protein